MADPVRRDGAAGRASFERVSPITGAVVSVAPALTVAEAQAAANRAAEAFAAWSQTGPGERRAILNRAADVLLSRSQALSATMIAETGAAAAWARFNVEFAAEILRDAAAMTTQVGGDVVPSDVPGRTAFALRQPAGICLAIAPWNAPVLLAARAIAMPLACGNTVILKASEICPRTHLMLAEVLGEAGLPDAVMPVVTNAPPDAEAIVEALIAHPCVRRVNFTGSTRVGRRIAELSARHLKKCLLELGGKAPLLVLADADLDEAAKAAAFGAFMHQGQICMSTERIIVADAVADAFVDRLAARAESLKAGDPREGGLPLGTLIGAEAARRIAAIHDDAVAKGAEVRTGGPPRGTIMNPTVIDHVTPAMAIYREETFAPMVAVIRAGSEDEAVTIANDCDYGLAAAIFTRDIGRGLSLARRVESGICHINGATVSDEPQMPFGGVKASGYGRFGGRAAIEEFTELRWITISRPPGSYPL